MTKPKQKPPTLLVEACQQALRILQSVGAESVLISASFGFDPPTATWVTPDLGRLLLMVSRLEHLINCELDCAKSRKLK